MESIEFIIHKHFDILEGNFGVLTISWLASLIVSSSHGLTIAEMEDLLSCVDDVLRDVFVWWTPTVARFPPLVLRRLLEAMTPLTRTHGSGGSGDQHRTNNDVDSGGDDDDDDGGGSGGGGGGNDVNDGGGGDDRRHTQHKSMQTQLLSFNHDAVCAVVHKRYVCSVGACNAHRTLANYFDGSVSHSFSVIQCFCCVCVLSVL
jgi:hypothetical protein